MAAAGNVYHYADKDDLPQDMAKYYYQRHDLFSQYDKGILMTPEAFFEVTPEMIADAIASDIEKLMVDGKKTVIDCFAGVGGNTIAFAKADKIERVFAIENDPDKMKCLKHNLKLYGVDRKVFPVTGDVFKMLQSYKSLKTESMIFASPPWGGPDYSQEQVFDLNAMKPYNLEKLVTAMRKITSEIVLYLPRNSDLNQIAAFNTLEKPIPAIQYCLKGAGKVCTMLVPADAALTADLPQALAVYYGDWKG